MMSFALGGIGMVLFWLIIVALAILAIRGLLGLNSRSDDTRQTAAEILARRYAAGDITREEFEQRRQELGEARV